MLARVHDSEGRVQIDRQSLEALVIERARLRETSADGADRAAAEIADRQMRLSRERRAFEDERERRRLELLALKKREVDALEAVVEWLQQTSPRRLRAS